MSCQVHERIEEYRAQERDLVLRLRLTRGRRRHLEEALTFLEEPLGSDYPELVAHAIENIERETSGEFCADETQSEEIIPGERWGRERTYLSVARSLARKDDWRVRVADVAREVKRRNLSDAKQSSIYATLHKLLSKSEDWEKVGDGQFEYVNAATTYGILI